MTDLDEPRPRGGRPRGRVPTRRTSAAVGLAITLLGLCVAAAGPAAARDLPASAPARRPRRVLILSVPTLTWSDLSPTLTPTLLHLLDQSAVADLATRADRAPAQLGAAYVTIGAGTRAAGDVTTDGEGLATTERFGSDTAAQVFRQRTGRAPGTGLVDLGIARVVGANDKLLYDGRPGALGDALAHAGYSRAVVANGDGNQPDTSNGSVPSYFRAAVGALMGSDGRVPAGGVTSSILTRDVSAPYGVRLDQAAVERAFSAHWRDRSVEVVEASDLVRADRYTAYATSAERARQRDDALRWTDELAARLLRLVDPARDLVLVLSPAPETGTRSVTIAGLRGPGLGTGLMRSATTRRTGFVTLADVAPTVLEQLGIPRPESMEGRPMVVDAGHGPIGDRSTALQRANLAGLMRDDLVNPVTAAVIWTSIALLGACILLVRRHRVVAEAVKWLALALIGFMLATLPASALDLAQHGGKVTYWLFVSIFALAFAFACRLARRGDVDPLLFALGALLAVLVVDQFTGGHLEFNSVFGYSATVGIRFSGIGNQSSALLTAAAILVAALLAWRVRAPYGTRVAIAVLAVSFVAITPPLFGQDFGGTLAAAPAFALLAWMLLGRRVTVRAVAGLLAILLASGLVVGFLDLLRPSDQQTHVGRFFQKVGDEGFSGFATVIERKSGENAASFSTPIYLVLILVAIGVGLYLWRAPTRPLEGVVARIPTLRPAALSLLVLGVLSYGLNDSGLAIPAIMLSLVVTTGAYLLADTSPDPGAPTAAVGPPEKSRPLLTR